MFQTYNNAAIVSQLKHAIETKKLHHANLISSGPGEDGLPLGLTVARLLLCENNTDCGTCKGCTRVNKLEHPDLTLTFPVVSGGTSGTSDDYIKEFRSALISNRFLDPESWQQQISTKNQQLQIPVKEIQNLQHKLSLTLSLIHI